MILGYLDVGTGSLIVQTVLGGTAGLAVFFKSTGRRFIKRRSSTETTDSVDDLPMEQSTES